MNTSNIKISIDGNVGVGKQHFIKMLKKHTNAENVYIHSNEKFDICHKNIKDLFAIYSAEYYAEWSMYFAEIISSVYMHHSNKKMIFTIRSIDTYSNVLLKAGFDTKMIGESSYDRIKRFLTTYNCILQSSTIAGGTLNCIIYLKMNPHDLYDFLLSNHMYDSINIDLMINIDKRYSEYIKHLQETSTIKIIEVNIDATTLNDLYFTKRMPQVFRDVINELNETYTGCIN